MKQKPYKKDIILIAGLVVIGIVIGLVLLLTAKGGQTVQVRVSGEVVQTFSLSDTVEYEITGKGGGTNLLVIKDGQAWVEEADCPDKLCKNMGRINRVGQSVVCLPHEVVVEITDADNNENDVDIIVQ